MCVADVFVMLSGAFDDLAVNHSSEQVRAESRQRFESMLTFAIDLEAPGITVTPGVPFDDFSNFVAIDRASDD